MSESVKHIKSVEERSTLIKDTNIVVIDYYADWCKPCKKIAPEIEELASLYGKVGEVAIVKENIDDDLDLDSLPEPVKCLPTFHFYVNNDLRKDLTISGANVQQVSVTLRTLMLG